MLSLASWAASSTGLDDRSGSRSGSRSTPRRSARGATGSSPTVSTVSTTVPAELARHRTRQPPRWRGEWSHLRRRHQEALPTSARAWLNGSAHGRHDAHCTLPRAQCVYRRGVRTWWSSRFERGCCSAHSTSLSQRARGRTRTERSCLSSVPPDCRRLVLPASARLDAHYGTRGSARTRWIRIAASGRHRCSR